MPTITDELIYSELTEDDDEVIAVKMAALVIQGASPLAAYCSSTSHKPWEEADQRQIGMKAWRIYRSDFFQDVLARFKLRLEQTCCATLLEVQLFLTEAIRTPLSEIDEESPLCQEHKVQRRYDKDGQETVTTTYKAVSKLQAVKELSALNGWEPPKKVDIVDQGGVMLVPAPASLKDWAATAEESQKALMEDARNI